MRIFGFYITVTRQDPRKAVDWDAYAAGLRDGAGLSDHDGTAPPARRRKVGRRPHPHLQLVTS